MTPSPNNLAPRHRAVLAYLLLNSGTVISTARLIEAIWGMLPPDSARAQIQTTIAAIRRMLRAANADGLLSTHSAGYKLTPEPGQLDLDEFTSLVSTDQIRAALNLWRGEPLTGITADYVPSARARLNDRRLAALERLAETELDRGNHEALIDELAVNVTAHPLRERLTGQLMLALHRAGRQPEALEIARTFRQTLADQQGLDPGHTFVKLEQSILRDDAALRPGRPSYLPYDVPDFTGRTAELRELTGHSQIWAIDGMAGVGKTTLAVHAAHHLAGDFPDGQLFVDLMAHTAGQKPLSAGDALECLLTQLGVPAERMPLSPADRAALWRSELSGRRVLIVLDNALNAEHVRPLLPGTSGCVVLVTSRRRLTDLDGAQALSMEVLPAADAMELFTTIVGKRAEAEPVAVLDVLQLCGFLPLAVRIAAARLHHRPSWTVAYLAERLRDQRRRLSELATAERGVASAFTLSYEQLGPDRQRMFRLLGLQPGRDLTADAAAALAGLSLDEAEIILEDLLDAHLLSQRVPGRYVLHDLLREHALNTVNAQESLEARDEALARLSEFYLNSAGAAANLLYPAQKHLRPQLPAPARPPQNATEALTWLETERANLIAIAHHTVRPGDLVITLATYLLHRAPQADTEALFDLALQASRQAGDPAAEVRVLLYLGEILFWFHGDCERAADNFRSVLKIARDLADRYLESRAVQNLAAVHLKQRAYGEAQRLFELALALNREADKPLGVAGSLTCLGVVHGCQGRYAEAHDHHRQAQRLYREAGVQIAEAPVLNHIGLVYKQQGHAEQAHRHHREALELCRALRLTPQETVSLNGLAEAARSMGDPAQAVAEHEAALALARDLINRPEQARAHDGLARAHRDLGNHDRAYDHARQALDLYTDFGVPEADEMRAFLAEAQLSPR
ncbi:AfsR/SARP family transcriptional regulator [Nonomuraea soli]|uniref:DNA-binding SARP family transcriptional activator/tetratricopeptide (TPR) repeat protein n=1 Tax=Nonomuraea soli TaxID=1032476 RepID=A0A7W0HQY1_9ACTN|nr:BTAD domain-containing putative transcriptional regulator [Nonomuraea soli]MBA2892360.1 DNA-binding SARP family transcriptional activator/tetratricopeptide (TPR) repeat protein [Nonomuraea soli]